MRERCLPSVRKPLVNPKDFCHIKNLLMKHGFVIRRKSLVPFRLV